MSRLSNISAILHAQSEGYSAHLEGLRIPDCPYDDSDAELRSAWVRGFAAVRTGHTRTDYEATQRD